MKLSKLTKGTKILLPCPSCGVKRSLTFQSIAEYKNQLKRACHDCANRDTNKVEKLESHRLRHSMYREELGRID